MSSNSINLRGIRTGTPVPSKAREDIANIGNTLVEYTMTPEEMNAYLNERYPKRKGRVEVNLSVTATRPEVSKDEYLKLRVQGISRLDAGKQLGLGPVNLSRCLNDWGIECQEEEQKAIQKMAEIIVESRRAPAAEEPAVTEKQYPTKESYLELRLQGIGRIAACVALGIARGSSAHWLKKWGLEDAADEERLLEEMKAAKVPAVSIPQTAPAPHAAPDPAQPKSGLPANLLTVSIPSTPADWPEELHLDRVDRDELILIGVTCLRNAAAWAHKELADLLGDDAAETHVQAFITRKCAQILSDVNG